MEYNNVLSSQKTSDDSRRKHDDKGELLLRRCRLDALIPERGHDVRLEQLQAPCKHSDAVNRRNALDRSQLCMRSKSDATKSVVTSRSPRQHQQRARGDRRDKRGFDIFRPGHNSGPSRRGNGSVWEGTDRCPSLMHNNPPPGKRFCSETTGQDVSHTHVWKKKNVQEDFFELGHKIEKESAHSRLATHEAARETNQHRINVRQKQIDFGYNTLGYARYLELVPRNTRGPNKNEHPRTPDPYQVCSKRSYDGQIRKWRRLLHAYDPPEVEGEQLLATAARRETDTALTDVLVLSATGKSGKEGGALPRNKKSFQGGEETDAMEGPILTDIPAQSLATMGKTFRSIYDDWEGSEGEFCGVV